MGDARLRRRRDGRLWHKGRRRRIVVVNVDIVVFDVLLWFMYRASRLVDGYTIVVSSQPL
jgi:hypothetical protein